MTASKELLEAAEHLAAARALNEKTTTETKTLDSAIMASSDGTYQLCFSVFDVLDSHGDIVQPGAFAKTIRERGPKLPVLWNHDLTQASIGVVRSIAEIPKSALPDDVRSRWPEASGAMLARVKFFDTPRANEIVKGIDDGAPYQGSFMYDALGKESRTLDNGRKARILTDVRVHELTVCHFGSNPATYLAKTAYALLAEYEAKAGRRHSARDDELIEAIVELGIALGARNYQRTTQDAAAPLLDAARTTEHSPLISSIRKLLETIP